MASVGISADGHVGVPCPILPRFCEAIARNSQQGSHRGIGYNTWHHSKYATQQNDGN
jgi:hypothetical protein